jgi:hypothetical protein
MRNANLGIAILFFALCHSDAIAKPTYRPITVQNACDVAGAHAEYRWDAKTDQDRPPPYVTVVKPSDIAAWTGPGGGFDKNTERQGKENKWFELTGRVKLLRIEPDGALHIQLADVKADARSVNVVVAIPYGDPWCGIRRQVFSWTNRKLPFKTRGANLKLMRNPIISVTGKAFYDAAHAAHGDTTLNMRKSTNSKRQRTSPVGIGEIRPVMNLRLMQDK